MKGMTALAGALLLPLTMALAVTPAAASDPPTTIEIRIDFEDTVEPFTATGPVLCPSGTATSAYEHVNPFFTGPAITYHLTKTLVCADDAANTLTIAVDAGANFIQGKTRGGWSVVDGTGEYAGLHGGGRIVGIYQDVIGGVLGEVDLIDYYTGQIH